MKSDYYQSKVTRVKKAIVNLKQAVKADNKNPRALSLLGRAYLTLGNWEKANEYLLQALNLNNIDPFTISLIAVSHASAGNLKVAYKIVDKAMKQHDEFRRTPGFSALIPTVRALICYDYEKGKKQFKQEYSQSKLEASIGNDGKNFKIIRSSGY